MNNFKKILLMAAFYAGQTFALGQGYSSHPLMPSQKLLTTEMTGIVADGGGFGIQGRFTYKVSKRLAVDAGLGIAGGEHSGRIFAGADYEILPDYMNQPKFSMKLGFMNSEDFGQRINTLSVAPTASKGFSFWGKEAYPFVALPIALKLNSTSQRYETAINLRAGMTGPVPVKGYNHLMANVEASLNIKDSYSTLFMGVSYPIK